MVWDKTKCAEGILAPDLNDEIRENNEALEAALTKDHHFSTGETPDSQQGLTRQGSARCFWQAAAPATRTNGDAFTSIDLGSVWIDSDDNKIYILTATTPTWTNISVELFATFLAAARVFGSTLGITGNFAVNTDKFTVAAASGNTAIAGLATIAGTLGVTGVATLGDTSKLATSGAPTADDQLANKKYVDDEIDDRVGTAGDAAPAAVGAGTVSVTSPNGFIMKWGTGSSTTDSAEDFTFPVAFPNACYDVQTTPLTANTKLSLSVSAIAKNKFTINRHADVDNHDFRWRAIGY